MSVKDELQLMLAFGTFTTELIKIGKNLYENLFSIFNRLIVLYDLIFYHVFCHFELNFFIFC
ncbi:hypothetical protein GYW21_05000 [Lactobacillus mellis]|nr:hypothetical protein [Bombilactobacillus mellis]